MIQNAKILQRQDNRANLEAVKRNNFIAFDTDANHLLYCKDGNNWFDFYNASEVESKFLNLSSLYLPQSGIDASKVSSGVFDIARIPVLPSQVQVASSGDLTALTGSQQTQIGQGTVVTTTDGFRWVYSGAGSKTASASYTQLADITPDWTVISNKPTNVSTWFNDSGYLTASSSLAWAKLTGVPSSFIPSAHVHAISDVTGLQVALDGKQAAGSYLTTSYVPTWSSVTGKPTAVSTWTNDSGYLTASSLLTGFVTGTNTAIAATDSVLGAFQKLQGQINSKQASGSYLTTAYVPTWASLTGVPSTFTPSGHTQAWSTITSTPTSLAGYGITDAVALRTNSPFGVSRLYRTDAADAYYIYHTWSPSSWIGNNTWKLKAANDVSDGQAGITKVCTDYADYANNANVVPWSGVTGKPTTISGYGITDALAGAIWRDWTGNAANSVNYKMLYSGGVTPNDSNYSFGFAQNQTYAWMNSSQNIDLNVGGANKFRVSNTGVNVYGDLIASGGLAITGGATITGALFANGSITFGTDAGFGLHGDGHNIYIKPTSQSNTSTGLLPYTATTANNPIIGRSDFRFYGVYAGIGDFNSLLVSGNSSIGGNLNIGTDWYLWRTNPVSSTQLNFGTNTSTAIFSINYGGTVFVNGSLNISSGLTASGIASVQGNNLRYYTQDGTNNNTTYAGIYPNGTTWGANTFAFLAHTTNSSTFLNASTSLELQITNGSTRSTVLQVISNGINANQAIIANQGITVAGGKLLFGGSVSMGVPNSVVQAYSVGGTNLAGAVAISLNYLNVITPASTQLYYYIPATATIGTMIEVLLCGTGGGPVGSRLYANTSGTAIISYNGPLVSFIGASSVSLYLRLVWDGSYWVNCK